MSAGRTDVEMKDAAKVLADPTAYADDARLHAALTRLYEAGSIRPLVSERVPMAEAPAALARLASRGTVGKVVVLPWS